MEKMLGVMLDCSRNAVMKPETVKKYANIVKQMGYNTIMLYLEDTYEIESQPYFGHLRGRYTKDELKDIDSYCKEIDIELVPCIQTLAHLESMFKWRDQYSSINDCDDILLIGDENTYKLIEDMISTISECFSSSKIHIGMDEAYRVGTGKYQKKHGICNRFDVINGHLHKVCEITQKYGKEPMIWSDMFWAFAVENENSNDNNYNLEKGANLPENVSLVYWDYFCTDYDKYVKNIKTNKRFGRNVYFAGGAWTWKGFAPDNKFSIETTKEAMKACRDCNVDGVFFTLWGDDGSECSKFSVLPSLIYAAEIFKGNNDVENVKKKFKDITGCNFDDFMLFDELDKPIKGDYESLSKCIFYNDLFLGIRNNLEEENLVGYYKELASELNSVKNKGEFECLFKWYEDFAEVLAAKCGLGLRIKDAYKNNDVAKMEDLIKECDELLVKIEQFYESYSRRWFEENKPHGFDVQDIRIGGLLQRIKSCKKRLKQYVNNEINIIEELEERELNEGNGFPYWNRLVTTNVVSCGF